MPHAKPLGRRLFAGADHWGCLAQIALFAAFFFPLALSNFELKTWDAWIRGLVELVFGLLLMWWLSTSVPTSIVYYERGARKRWLWRVHTIAFEDVESLSYARGVIGQFQRLGTQFSIAGAKGERFWGFAEYDDEKARVLTSLQERVSAILVEKWQRRIEAGERMNWGKDVSLSREGVHVDGRVVPFDSDWTLAFVAKQRLRASVRNDVVFELPWDQVNFWPGLTVFEQRSGRRRLVPPGGAEAYREMTYLSRGGFSGTTLDPGAPIPAKMLERPTPVTGDWALVVPFPSASRQIDSPRLSKLAASTEPFLADPHHPEGLARPALLLLGVDRAEVVATAQALGLAAVLAGAGSEPGEVIWWQGPLPETVAS